MSGDGAQRASTELLTVSVDTFGTVGVMTLDGQLSPAAAVEARRCILEWLANGPRVLVLDLSGVTVPDLATTTLFAAMAEQPNPGQELLVAAPSPAVSAVLERLTPRSVLVFDTVLDAIDAVDDLVPRRFRELVPPWPGAQWQARRLVDQACATWGFEDLVDPARTIVSALVGNAVQHARTDAVVSVTRTSRCLLVGVRDGSHEGVVLAGHRAEFAAHRGLTLVQELSTEWGVYEVPDGKIVWAILRHHGT